MSAIILSIDGNIGAGKTTLLNDLKRKYPNWHFVDEPVDTWTRFVNEEGESLLEVFYKDRQRWSYTFQNCALLTRVRAITKAIREWKQTCERDPSQYKNNIFVTERSVETDFHVFAKMLHEDKSLNKMEWDMYRQWYGYLSMDTKVRGIIYVTCSPEKCSERIHTRGRSGEESIPMEYLQQLHKYHEDWINNTCTPVVQFNTELTNAEEYDTSSIDRFVESIN